MDTEEKKAESQSKLKSFLLQEGQNTFWIVLWILVNIILFGERVIGVGARASGATLKFNCALILFTVLRNFLSKLRASWIGNYIPVDSNIKFHKGIAWAIAFFTVIHVFCHFINFYNISQENDPQLVNEVLNIPIPNDQIPSPATLALLTLPGGTGHGIVVVMILVYSSAISRVRRPMFEVFWYTHHLLIIFYGLNCVHGLAALLEPPTFYIWFAVPGLLYLIERILRIYRGNQDTVLQTAIMHPSSVIELQMKKSTFNYKPGEYLFLACPYIASHEWHPFTITSAPDEEFVSVHIRRAGDWTGAVQDFLNPEKKIGIVQENVLTAPDGSSIFKIDGPYGAASEEVFDFEIVMLVGAGIGVTPFASILKSCRYHIERQLAGMETTPIKKVYFYWIGRDKNSFEWFAELLSVLEQENINNFLEINIFLTGGLSPDDIRNVMYGDDEEDAITGLESKTQFGRPQWDQIFDEHCRIYPGSDIGVFFCGPPPIAKELYNNSRSHTKGASGTKFHFYKENF